MAKQHDEERRSKWHRIAEIEMRELARRKGNQGSNLTTDMPEDEEDRFRILSQATVGLLEYLLLGMKRVRVANNETGVVPVTLMRMKVSESCARASASAHSRSYMSMHADPS